MEIFFIIILAVLVYWLWWRVNILDRQIKSLAEVIDKNTAIIARDVNEIKIEIEDIKNEIE